LYNIQNKIYVASLAGKKSTVHYLQQKLLDNIEAKYIAVRQVIKENKLKNIFREGGFLHLTSAQKVYLAETIEIDGKVSIMRKV
jgi:hypothetical protein